MDDVKDETPKAEDVRFHAMANEIGRLKIEALAQKAGAVDPAKVAEIVSKSTKADIDATGNVQLAPIDDKGERLRNDDGTPMTVAQYVNVLKASPDTGYYFQDGASKPKAKDGAKTPGGFDVEVNPWAAETWSLTEQCMIMKRDKVFGERLRAAAGQVAGAGNPFAAGPSHNLTLQAKILKENRELGEKLRQEAKPPENPFLKSQFNLTKQALLAQSNKALCAKLQAEAFAIDGPTKKSPSDYLSKPRFPVTRPKGWAGR